MRIGGRGRKRERENERTRVGGKEKRDIEETGKDESRAREEERKESKGGSRRFSYDSRREQATLQSK